MHRIHVRAKQTELSNQAKDEPCILRFEPRTADWQWNMLPLDYTAHVQMCGRPRLGQSENGNKDILLLNTCSDHFVQSNDCLVEHGSNIHSDLFAQC